MYIYARRPAVSPAETSAEPSLQAKQLQLKRARLADDLNDKISHRPGPIELVHKNILSVTCHLQHSLLGNDTHLSSTHLCMSGTHSITAFSSNPVGMFAVFCDLTASSDQVTSLSCNLELGRFNCTNENLTRGRQLHQRPLRFTCVCTSSVHTHVNSAGKGKAGVTLNDSKEL